MDGTSCKSEGVDRSTSAAARLIAVAAALLMAGTALAEEERVRIALHSELAADGKQKVGVENETQHVLTCRFESADGATYTIASLPPGATFWVSSSAPGKWNCRRR